MGGLPFPDDNPDPAALEAVMVNAMTQMTEMVKPFIKAQLIAMQEDPETAFATVIGGEIMIDFDRLLAVLINPMMQGPSL